MIDRKSAQDPAVIARLQAEAARHPRAYRLRLAILAVFGDVALTATQVLPWAAPIVVGAVFMGSTAYYWLAAAAIAFLVWVLRPTFRFEGRELKREEAATLYEELDSLRRTLDVAGPMRVYLDESFNAGALETRGFLGLFGTRRALILGVPLLAALSREQVLSVIAHEMGHFSRRHGRLGHWLYRARVGWTYFEQQVGEADSAFDKAAAWYARQFIPFFSARSFVLSRQCEYEADADAALAAGSAPFAEALTRTAIVGHLWEKLFPRQIIDWQLESPEPPKDFYERFSSAARTLPAAKAEESLQNALRESASWVDTHPSLSERLRALKQEPRSASFDSSAGSQLIGKAWRNVLAEFNSQWCRNSQSEWLSEHVRLKHVVHPFLSVDTAIAQGWPREKRLARAKALRATEPAAGLAELRTLHREDPTDPQVSFAYAAALLNEDDDAGVELMEKLARERPPFRIPAFLRALGYFERKGDSVQVERWSNWLKAADERQQAGLSPLKARLEAGRARPSSLPSEQKAAIAEAIRLDPCVKTAWLFADEAEFAYSGDKTPAAITVHALMLAIELSGMERVSQDESAVRQRYARLLQSLIPPEQIAVVRTYFTTEPLPLACREHPQLAVA